MGRTTTPLAWHNPRSGPHHDDGRTLLLPAVPSTLGVHRWRRHNVLNDICSCSAHRWRRRNVLLNGRKCCVDCWRRRHVLNDGRRSNGKHFGSWCDADDRTNGGHARGRLPKTHVTLNQKLQRIVDARRVKH